MIPVDTEVKTSLVGDAAERVGGLGRTALHWAAAVNNVESVLILVQRDANRDAQDSQDETPLFLAAREGSREAVRALLDAGANRDLPDHMDRLPKDVAVERLHHDIAQLLLDDGNAAAARQRYRTTPTTDGVLLQADCLLNKGKQKKGLITVIVIKFSKTCGGEGRRERKKGLMRGEGIEGKGKRRGGKGREWKRG